MFNVCTWAHASNDISPVQTTMPSLSGTWWCHGCNRWNMHQMQVLSSCMNNKIQSHEPLQSITTCQSKLTCYINSMHANACPMNNACMKDRRNNMHYKHDRLSNPHGTLLPRMPVHDPWVVQNAWQYSCCSLWTWIFASTNNQCHENLVMSCLKPMHAHVRFMKNAYSRNHACMKEKTHACCIYEHGSLCNLHVSLSA